MIVAEFLLCVMRQIGVSHAFSLVGGMSMHLNRFAGATMDVTYCNHEQAVVAAADGYTKAADFLLPGLAIVTSGPGVSNTITSLCSAFYDSVPLILLSGQVKAEYVDRFGTRSHGPQEVPHSEILRPITKLTFSYHPGLISNKQLADNLALSMIGRKGPIHIDVPLDVQAMDSKSHSDVDEVVLQYHQALERVAPKSATNFPVNLIKDLETAKRPLLILGNGLKIASVSEKKIDALVRHFGWPVLLTWASMDLMDYADPLNFGCAGGLAGIHSNKILQAADLIILLGTRLDLLTTGFNPARFGNSANRYVIDCDPAELEKHVGIDRIFGINLDVHDAVYHLLNLDITRTHETSIWLDSCKELRAENQAFEDREFSSTKLNSYHVAALMSQSPNTHYVVPTASGFAIEGFARFFKPTRGSKFAWAGHVLGSMGLALPAAIGACVRLKKSVICVDGDGGFLLNMQELYTLRANRSLAISIFVLNNRGYTSISQSQTRVFQQEFGASARSGLADVSFELLAKIGGLEYVACTSYAKLEQTISSLQPHSRILVDILMEDDNYRGPAIKTKFDEHGRPYSTPLEDVEWR